MRKEKFDLGFEAFNAALAVFGSLLVPCSVANDLTAEIDRHERGRQFLDKAVDALLQLHPRNPVLERCVNYVRQLSKLVEAWSEFKPHVMTSQADTVR